PTGVKGSILASYTARFPRVPASTPADKTAAPAGECRGGALLVLSGGAPQRREEQQPDDDRQQPPGRHAPAAQHRGDGQRRDHPGRHGPVVADDEGVPESHEPERGGPHLTRPSTLEPVGSASTSADPVTRTRS